MKSLKDYILVIVTIVLLIVLGVCIYRDRDRAVLDRTLGYDLPSDLKIVAMDKHGSLFARNAYEAKIEVPHDDPESIRNIIWQTYQFEGEMMNYSEFIQFRSKVLAGYSIYPSPTMDSYVWLQGIEDENGHHIYHIMCAESDSTAYLYIYYER